MTAREAREIDAEGKGGGLVDGKLVREFQIQLDLISGSSIADISASPDP